MIFLLLFSLVGCSENEGSINQALFMRERILSAKECNFLAEITADYGDKIQTFTLSCTTDSQGNLTFTVAEPDIISGISGRFDETGGDLKFDEEMLAFPLLAEGQISPVSVPWILMRTLRSGYISACGRDGDLMRATINDSYAENALQMEIWFDDNLNPVQGEIIWEGRRILTVVVSNFVTV